MRKHTRAKKDNGKSAFQEALITKRIKRIDNCFFLYSFIPTHLRFFGRDNQYNSNDINYWLDLFLSNLFSSKSKPISVNRSSFHSSMFS